MSKFLAITTLIAGGMFLVAPTTQADTPLTCNMQTFSGEDDVAHQMNLPFNLFLGGTDYNQVYLTTNATMTFGQPDATFHAYPQTTSVSLAGWDWVTWGQGAYVSYGYNSNSFCIEWSVRPFPTSEGDLTQIRLMVNRFNNGNWHGEITTFGWLPENLRRGIVATQGAQPLIIEAAFDVIRGVPIEVEPAPAPTDFTAPPQVTCWDGSQASSMSACPEEPAVTCWNGEIVHYQSECTLPPSFTCWNGDIVTNSSECLPIPPPIECWDGSVIDWNQTCPQLPPLIECWDGSEVNWNEQCPTRTLNPPGNVYGEVRSDGVYIYWDVPSNTGTLVERYAVSWICEGCAGYGWSSTATSVLIPFSTFMTTGGVGINYTFSVRADNDTTATYSSNTVGPTLFVEQPVPSPTPTPSPEPTQSQSPEPTVTPTPQPSEPSPQPTETSEPPLEPSPTPTPSSSPSKPPLPPVAPVVTPSPTPEQPTSSPSPEAPVPTESPVPSPSPSSTDNPSNNLTTEEIVSEILETYDEQEAVPFSVLEEAGIDYSDLPPEQPVMIENGVILTAEVADALESFDNIDQFLATAITDPGKLVKAFANVGADMTQEKREEAQVITISVIVYAQLMNGLSAANMLMRRF